MGAVRRDTGRVEADGKGKGSVHNPEGKGHIGGKGKSDASWAQPRGQDRLPVELHTSGTQLASELANLVEGLSPRSVTAAKTTDVASADAPLGKYFEKPWLSRASSAPASSMRMLRPVTAGSSTHTLLTW